MGAIRDKINSSISRKLFVGKGTISMVLLLKMGLGAIMKGILNRKPKVTVPICFVVMRI